MVIDAAIYFDIALINPGGYDGAIGLMDIADRRSPYLIRVLNPHLPTIFLVG